MAWWAQGPASMCRPALALEAASTDALDPLLKAVVALAPDLGVAGAGTYQNRLEGGLGREPEEDHHSSTRCQCRACEAYLDRVCGGNRP